MIGHEIKPGWSVSKEYCKLEGKYLLPQIFWAKWMLDIYYPWWELDGSDVFELVYSRLLKVFRVAVVSSEPYSIILGFLWRWVVYLVATNNIT